jgi:translation initiation factor IF-2
LAELKDSEAIGVVREYFRKPGVAAVQVLRGRVKVGDSVRFLGHTTDFTQLIKSMQMNHTDIPEAGEGDFVGILVGDRVRENDKMFLSSGDKEVSL